MSLEIVSFRASIHTGAISLKLVSNVSKVQSCCCLISLQVKDYYALVIPQAYYEGLYFCNLFTLICAGIKNIQVVRNAFSDKICAGSF